MEILLSTIDAVYPMFALIFVGYICNKTGLIKKEHALYLNKFSFYVTMPCLMFKSSYSAKFNSEYLKLSVFIAASFIISLVVMIWIVPKFIKRRGQAGAVIQGAFRSNSAAIGLILMNALCGDENMAPMAVVVTIATLMFNAMAVIVLTKFSENNGGEISTRALVVNVLKNPLIIGALVGILLLVLPVNVPERVLKPVYNLSACATPIAMVAIGSRFSLKSFTSNKQAIAFSTVAKLVVMPVVWTCLGFLLGFRGAMLCAIYSEHAVPSATAGASMADAMGCDGTLAGEIVVAQSAFGLGTMFVGVFLMKLFGFA